MRTLISFHRHLTWKIVDSLSSRRQMFNLAKCIVKCLTNKIIRCNWCEWQHTITLWNTLITWINKCLWKIFKIVILCIKWIILMGKYTILIRLHKLIANNLYGKHNMLVILLLSLQDLIFVNVTLLVTTHSLINK